MIPLRILMVLGDGDAQLAPLAAALREAGHQVRLADGDVASDLLATGSESFDAVVRAPSADRAAPSPLDAAERRHIAAALQHTRGNKRQAAHLLGIARSTLLAKVRKYQLG